MKLTSYLNTLKLAILDLRNNQTVRAIISDSIIYERYEDRLSFTNLKRFYFNRTGEDLMYLMKLSAINNNANDVQLALLDNIVDSFQLGDIYYRPILNIPFSDEVNLTLNPYIGCGWITPFVLPKVTNYSNNIILTISDENRDSIKNNPCWLVNFRYKAKDHDWEEFSPFNRCTCKPTAWTDGDGVIHYKKVGKCSDDYNWRLGSCGRGGFFGGCPNDECSQGPVRTDQDTYYPPMN